MVICLEQGADLHMTQRMPLSPTVSCFSKIQIGFTFLVPAHLGSPGKRVVKTGVPGMCLVYSSSPQCTFCACVWATVTVIFSVLLLLMLLWYLVFDAARVNYCIKQNCFLSVLVQCFKHKQKVFPLIIVCRYSSDSIGMDLVLVSKWNVAFTILFCYLVMFLAMASFYILNEIIYRLLSLSVLGFFLLSWTRRTVSFI